MVSFLTFTRAKARAFEPARAPEPARASEPVRALELARARKLVKARGSARAHKAGSGRARLEPSMKLRASAHL